MNAKLEWQRKVAWRSATALFVIAECFAVLAAVESVKNGWGPGPMHLPPWLFFFPSLPRVPGSWGGVWLRSLASSVILQSRDRFKPIHHAKLAPS